MKRFAVILLTIILLAACLPSAFCLADSPAYTRLTAILEALRTAEDYADPATIRDVEEAESLIADPTVAAECTEEQLAAVAEYRHLSDRAVVLAELHTAVQLYRRVRFADGEVRKYADGEWQTIDRWQTELIQDMSAQTNIEAMRAAVSAYLDRVRTLPVYDEVYDSWELRFNAAVRAEADLLYDKVNRYREGLGLAPLYTPTFIVAMSEDSATEFAAFAAANVTPYEGVVEAYFDALYESRRLGFYVDVARIKAEWSDYEAAVAAVTPVVDQAEIALDTARRQAVETLRAAIEASDYVQSLSGTDLALYRALPQMMEESLASAENEDEVREILDGYMALLTPDALEPARKGLDGLAVAAIVVGAVSVLLFAVYFIMRRRTTRGGDNTLGAEIMLAELQSMADGEASYEAESQEGDLPTEGEDDSAQPTNASDAPSESGEQEDMPSASLDARDALTEATDREIDAPQDEENTDADDADDTTDGEGAS